MRNLLAFIWKYQFFLLFICLELIAAYFSIQVSRHHRTAFLSTTYDLTNRIHAMNEGVAGYFRLRQENRALSEENAFLRSRASESFLLSDSLEYFRNDTIFRQQYRFQEARVISNSITLSNNILIINKGSSHGLMPDMGVISPEGVVGIVSSVTQNFASLVSVLNSNTRISAELKGTGFRGTVVWNGKSYRRGTVEDVPSHAPAAVGDSVVTSSDSQIFPSGILIGTIRDVSVDGGTGFYTITIDFSCDYNRLREVYIVNNLFKAELDSLRQMNATPLK